ncbi:MAG TPA: PilZ domain-containing protein [Bdellovibrionales bacterium]|nr:PilZ domain-containing protein [Bdellovibrionales bacterium]
MQRVLICCKSIADARFLKNYMETELPYNVMMSLDQKEVEGALKAKSVHLLLLQTGNLASQDIVYAQRLRKTGFASPILMLTDAVGNIDIEELHERHKIFFLERPFELKTLKGLARKLMITKEVPQQIFRRYRTNLMATLETFISGEKYETHMFNLSRGGAYFELPKKPMVNVGDLLRLKVHLADVSREHNVHGRVVWTTHKGHAAGGYGLGVKFMRSTDIYRNLLDKV